MAEKYWWQNDEQKSSGTNSGTSSGSSSEQSYWWKNGSVQSTIANNITSRVNTWLKNHNNYLSNYQSRYKYRKYNYDDPYVKDSASWLDTVSKQKSAFDQEADSILAYLDQYKGFLDADWVKSVQDTLTSARGQQNLILENSTKDNEWWSSFADETEYKTAQRYDGYNQKYSGQKYDDIQKALSALENGEEKDWLSYNQYDLYQNDRTYQSKAMSGLKSFEAQKVAERETEANKTWWDKAADFIIDANSNSYDNPMLDSIMDAREVYTEDTSWREMNDKWSEGQKRQFGYLYAESPAKAYKYAEQVNNQINALEKYEQQQAIGAAASQNFGSGTLGTLGAIASAPMGMADFMDDLIEYSARGTITQKNALSPFEMGQAAQSGIANKLNEKYGTIDDDKFIIGGKGLGDVYSLGVSAANSLVSAYTMGGAGTLVNFIGQGGAAGVDDALSRGATAGQALLYGSIVGAAEGLTEMINADNLLKIGSSATLKNYLLKALNQGIGESVEEGASSIIGNIADRVIMQDKSNFKASVKTYMENGMTEAEAKKKAWVDMVGDVVFDAMGGFATGMSNAGLTGGVSTALDARKGNQANIKAVEQYGAHTDDLIQEGLQSDKKSQSYKLAQKYQKQTQGKDGKAGKAMTGYQIRNLVKANDSQFIVERLTELGEDSKSVSKVAELVAKRVSGEELTKAEKSTLARSKFGAQVAKEFSEPIQQTQNGETAYNAQYKSITERVGEESRYGVSESGQTTLRNENEAVTIDEVVTVEDGQMTVKLTDGREVYAGDIDFASDSESFLYSAIADMENITPAAATALVKNFDATSKQTTQEYVNGIDEAYTYGFHGYSVKDMKAGQFTSNLSSEQMMSAYELGKAARKISGENAVEGYKKMRTAAQAEAEKATAEGKEAPKAKKLAITYNHGGGVIEDIATAENKLGKLNEEQRAGIEAAKILHQMGIGTDFELFTSYASKTLKDKDGNPLEVFLNDDGQEQAAYAGVYMAADGKIRINLNAYSGTKGLTLNALSHELTHFIKTWSLEKYTAMAEFLVKSYGEHGKSMHDLVLKEQSRLEGIRGKEVSYDEAYDEVVANAFNRMLEDGKVMERIAEIRQVDKSLADKIIEGIKKFIKRFTNVYRKNQSLFMETEALMEMKEVFEQLQAMFAEALVDASDNFQAAQQVGFEFDTQTESVAPAVELKSENTWKQSDYVQERDKAAKEIAKAIGVSEQKAKDYIDSVNSIAKMIAEDRSRLDYFSSPGRSSFVGNVEYGGSFDFSTLCKKRRLLTGTFTAIQKALPNTALTADEILDIRNRMKKANLEVSCGLCYVEGSRANMGQFAKEFLRLYKQYYPDAWQPNMADVNTPDGIEWVRINHPECYEQYEYFWNHYGTLKEGDKNLFASQQKPKLYQLHTEYKGEILDKFKGDDNVEEKNLNGGIRLQSFSDFEIVHLIDTMQIIMDMSRVGLAGQAYTKVPDFAWALGDTGLKINLSLIAKGVDANGKLIFDDVEGMPIAEAMKLRDRYSKNVGTILVAFNDEQLLAAMADDRVDFIIPFHRSQWKKSQYEAMGLPAKTKDYTYMQNEKFIKPQYHEYRGRMVKDKATNYMPNEYWDFSKSGKENAEAYLEMCTRNNKRPKFYKLLQNNGDGSYSLKADGSTDGYWKLLIDFKMYDNEGNGSPQMSVKPDFNMDEANRMLNDYKGGHSNFPVAQGIVDGFVKDYKESHKGEQYSSQETDFSKEFDYSELNWAMDLGIITSKDKAIFERTINNEIHRGAKPQSKNGEYIIDTGRCLMFTDGDFHSPTLSRVIEFVTEYESLTADAKEMIVDEAKATGEVQQSIQAIEKMFGPGFVSVRNQPIGRSYGRQVRGRKGNNRNGTAQKVRSIKEMLAAEGKEHLLYSSQETDLGNAPTFYSQMGKVVEGMKQDKFGASSVISMLRGRGVKAEEIRWSGIQAFLEGKKSVTKAELLDFIKGSMLHIEEENRGGNTALDDFAQEWLRLMDYDSSVVENLVIDDDFIAEAEQFLQNAVDEGNLEQEEMDDLLELAEKAKGAGKPTKWDQYKLDGGENYRELVFKMPGSTYTNRAMRGHWGRDAQGVLAHARMQDFNTFIGKMLFIEEIQSDWHNVGHRSGYGEAMSDEERNRTKNDILKKFVASDAGKDIVNKTMRYWALSEAEAHKKIADDPADVGAELLAMYPFWMNEARLEAINKLDEQVSNLYRKRAADAPFKDNYHEYVLKRLIRMAAEEGYDSIGWTTADIQSDRWSDEYAEGYRIEYDQEMPKFLRKYGKQWGTTVGKTVLDNGKEVWAMAITDSMQESVLTEGQALYSTQQTDNITNRHLLANAFEGISQNSVEYKMIQDYKDHIKQLNELETELHQLNAEIRKIRFGTEGARDTQRLAHLEDKAKRIAKDINRYDKRLLNMEASEPLRKVIDRERRKEAQKTKDHVKEIQQNKKVRAEQTELRHKIRKAVRDLDKLLNRGNKKLNVKEDMQNVVTKALKAADILFTDNYGNYDMLRNGIGADLSDSEEELVNTCTRMLKDIDKMPSDGYESWQARQEAENRLSIKMAKLKDVFARERKRLNNTTVSSILGELADAYASLEKSEQSYVQGAYTEAVHNFLKSLQSEVGGTIVRDMTKSQLESVYAAYQMVLNTVRNANKMFNEELKQSREQLGNAVIQEVTTAGGTHGLWTKGEIARNQASWNNMKPVWVANRIGSETFGKLMNGLFKGQYNFAVDVDEAKQFKLSMDEKYHPRNWDAKKLYSFVSSTGRKFDLNLQQIMSLYAFSKREQAYSHILNGGFVFEANSTVLVDKMGIKRTYLHDGATSYKLNEVTLNEIINSLTAEQKAYVDEMQKYLSEVMGAKGNEVSMKLYGIQMFKEKFYFPLRSSGAYMERAKEAEMKKQQGQINLVNSGFTHAVKPEAKNPIILSGFMDIWAEHCNEMSMYHSMVLPMEDFRKVYNYSTVHDEKMDSASVYQTIQDAYGNAATSYIDQLYRELNAGATVDPRETAFKARISKFKKAAVMLSASVVMQQFSSIGRAYAVIDPKYFVGTKVKSDTKLSVADEMKKYAPVAIIKEMGGFDTGTKGSAKSYIMAEQYKGIREGAKGLVKDEQFRGDIMSYFPAKADEITWCSIWEAVKRETKAKHQNMDVKSEEFLKLAGDRFAEIIEKTQVYDSVLARSANMRSKGGLMSMATAFMAEPTTTINLLEDAFRGRSVKNIARAFGAVAVSIVLNNALASVIYAMRDDDEDETFLEKYFQSFASGMVDDINPMTYYPFLKDVHSLFQGYDVERADMSVIADLRDALKKAMSVIGKDTSEMDEDELVDHYKQVNGVLMSLLDAGCSWLGVPVKNVRRDANGIINAYQTISKDITERDTTWNTFWDKVGSAVKDTLPIYAWTKGKSKQDKLYEAIMSGDKTYLGRIKSTYKTDDAYHSAVRTALREKDPRVREAAKAQISGNPSERVRIAKQIIADGFDLDDVIIAINSEISKLTPDDSSDTKKAKGMYKVEDFVTEASNGDLAVLGAIKEDILQTAQKNGKTVDEAEKAFVSDLKSKVKEEYIAGSLNDATAKKLLSEYTDMDEEEVTEKVSYWAFVKAHPQYDLNEAQVGKYHEIAEPADIPLDVFVQYLDSTKDLATIYDKWGDEVKSKREQVLEVIDSLPLTWQQKDALYLAQDMQKAKS